MKDSICVDYLSFEWSSEDLILAFKELKREKQKNFYGILTHQNARQLKKLNIEKTKQSRYENVLWRQMAKSCTNNLGYSNTLVDPCLLNWQKESDVTWLYGPLYVLKSEAKTQHHSKSNLNDTKMKSILKKKVYIQDDYWRTDIKFWSKCASESGKQSVRFNSDITEIQYIPDMPIASQHPLIEQDEDEDDEEFNLFLSQLLSTVTHYFKSILFYVFIRKTSTNVIQFKKASVFQLNLFNFCISTITFTTWFMYQTLLSIIYNTLTNTRKHTLSS